jgi:hypothetical protein
MSNHAAITFFAKPLVEQSRGFWAEKQSRSNHGNHEIRETAGRAITQAITAITHTAITPPTPSVGGGVGGAWPLLWPHKRQTTTTNRDKEALR